MTKNLALTEAQRYALELILESTVSCADPSRYTASYVAIIRKLRRIRDLTSGRGKEPK